jgi:hypothetical protein
MAVWPELDDPDGGPSWDRGRRLLLLHLSRPTWVHRRVETIELVSEATVRRRTSNDLSLSTYAPPADLPGGATELVPLTLLAKRPLVGFDVRDESGAPLPVLTRAQNGRLAWELLLAATELERGGPPPAEVATALRDVVVADADDASARLAPVGEAGRGGPAVADPALLQLAASPLVGPLLAELATNFLLVVPVPFEQGKRRVLALTYLEPLERDRDDIPAQLGWRPSSLVFDLAPLAYSSSYHVEVLAPGGLAVVGGRVEATDGDAGARLATTAERLHAHLPGGGSSGTADPARAVVEVAVTRRGLLRAGTLTAWGALALLVAVAAFADRVDDRTHGPLAALLLLVPTVAAAWLVRPGEHGLVASLLFWGRAAILVVSVVAMSAATTVVLAAGSPSLRHLLALHAVVAVAPTLVLTLALARSAR